MTPMTVRISPAMQDDPEAVNDAILELAAQRREGDEVVVVHVDYEGRGDDIVKVHRDGTIEVVTDGSPTV